MICKKNFISSLLSWKFSVNKLFVAVNGRLPFTTSNLKMKGKSLKTCAKGKKGALKISVPSSLLSLHLFLVFSLAFYGF